jgi:hypothetical protein
LAKREFAKHVASRHFRDGDDPFGEERRAEKIPEVSKPRAGAVSVSAIGAETAQVMDYGERGNAAGRPTGSLMIRRNESLAGMLAQQPRKHPLVPDEEIAERGFGDEWFLRANDCAWIVIALVAFEGGSFITTGGI